MSDGQRSSSRITSLGGIKPSRMPASAVPEIPVSEAEVRLGITGHSSSDLEAASKVETQRAGTLAALPEGMRQDRQAGRQDNKQESRPESNTGSLPASLLTKRVKQITVSRTFRLPLALANELEHVSALHDIPMVTILAEALEIHLARFPRQKSSE